MAASRTEFDKDFSEYIAHCFEADVSFEGDKGLQKHYRNCSKNPGHEKFIPMDEFTLEHLPPEYRDQDVFDCVQAMNILTCRVSVKGASQNRPECFPGSSTQYPHGNQDSRNAVISGTGWIMSIYIFISDGDCLCSTCMTMGHPKKECARIHIRTASHVVFDKEEALRTRCIFFFNKGILPGACPGVVSLPVSDFDHQLTAVCTEADSSELVVYTHDIKLAQLFLEARDKLREKALAVQLKFDGTQSQARTEDSFSNRDFLRRLMSTFNRLYIGIRIMFQKNQWTETTTASLDELNELDKQINDFLFEQTEQRDFNILIEEINTELDNTKINLAAFKTVSAYCEHVESAKTKITDVWQRAEKNIFEFLSILQFRNVCIFDRYKEDAGDSLITYMDMNNFLQSQKLLLETLLNDFRVFADFIKRDLLILRKVFDSWNSLKVENYSLMNEIDDLEFTLIESRGILLDEFSILHQKNSFFSTNHSYEIQLHKYYTEMEARLFGSYVKGQQLLQRSSSPLPSCTIEMLIPIPHFRTLFLTMLVKVRHAIVACARNLNIFVRGDSDIAKHEISKVAGVEHLEKDGSAEIHCNIPATVDSNGDRMIETTRPLVIIVSHPHGTSKHVTVGYLDTETDVDYTKNNVEDLEFTFIHKSFMVSYTTPTCPGSSGSQVFVLNSQRFDFVKHDPNFNTYSTCTHSGSCGARNHSTFARTGF